MVEPVDPEILAGNKSAFMSFLDWIDRPGQAVMALLQGEGGRAGRQLLDFIGEVPDALLPGDLIPNATTDEDFIAPSELVGMDAEDPWYTRIPADIVLGTALNPLSYAGGLGIGGAIGKAAGGAVKAIPKADEALGAIRRATGNLNLTPEAREGFDAARGAGQFSGQVATEAAKGVAEGLTQAERLALGRASLGAIRKGDEVIDLGDPRAVPLEARLAKLRDVLPEEDFDFTKVQSAAERARQAFRGQVDEFAQEGALVDRGLDPDTYFPRFRTGAADESTEALAGMSPIKGRVLKEHKDLLEAMAADPSLNFVEDAGEALLRRAAGQGKIIERARAVRKFIGDDAILNDPKTGKAINELLEVASKNDPDFARMFQTVAQGMTPRKGPMELIAKANRWFKPSAVFGLGIPRFAGISKNRLGGVWQALSAGDMGLAMRNLKRLPSDMANSFGFKIGGKELTQSLDDLGDAVKAAGGDVNKARELLRAKNPVMAQAVEMGVIDDGFVRAEQLLSQMNALSQGGKASQKFQTFLDFPARVFQGIEQRMRLGTFYDLVKGRGMAPGKAAQVVQDAYLDYAVVGEGNRLVRDMIPFAAFTMKSIPQQAKFVAQRPQYAIAAGQLFGERGDDVLPPWVSEQMNVGPLGEDDEGNPIYAAGLGLPLETLNLLPSADALGADLRRGVVASSQPLLKGVYGGLTGRDPFFDTPYGSYDKAPEVAQALGADERSEAARIYNIIEGLGLIQPVASLEGQISKLIDPEDTTLQSLANVFTGARFVGVDEDRALQQQLQAALARNPDIEQYSLPFTRSEDEDTRALLAAYNEVKKAVREKRKAEALQSAD